MNDGRAKYVFRINYEDVEQGADHDMDAIVTYTVSLNADNTVTIEQSSDYAAGGIIQHMGYVISGTSADGIYLNVRDSILFGDPDYSRSHRARVGVCSLLTSSRNLAQVLQAPAPCFSTTRFGTRPNGAVSSCLLDSNGKEIIADGTLRTPADGTTWDTNNDGVPDNYFLVVNPLKLEDQLKKAMDKIQGETGTAAALATNSSAWKQGAKLYQAKFSGDGWFGSVSSISVNSDGSTTTASDDWRAEVGVGQSGRNWSQDHQLRWDTSAWQSWCSFRHLLHAASGDANQPEQQRRGNNGQQGRRPAVIPTRQFHLGNA